MKAATSTRKTPNSTEVNLRAGLDSAAVDKIEPTRIMDTPIFSGAAPLKATYAQHASKNE